MVHVHVLEGISTSGKSTLMCALKEQAAAAPYAAFSQSFYSEHVTIRVFEQRRRAGTLTHGQAFAYLRQLIAPVKTVADALAGTEFAQHPHMACMVFERFGLSHVVQGDIDKQQLKALFTEIATSSGQPARLMLLQLSHDQVHGRLEHSLAHRNASWVGYVEHMGGVDKLATKLLDDQSRYLGLLGELENVVTPYVSPAPQSADEYAMLVETLTA